MPSGKSYLPARGQRISWKENAADYRFRTIPKADGGGGLIWIQDNTDWRESRSKKKRSKKPNQAAAHSVGGIGAYFVAVSGRLWGQGKQGGHYAPGQARGARAGGRREGSLRASRGESGTVQRV